MTAKNNAGGMIPRLLVAAALVLPACAAQQKNNPAPDLTFARISPMPVNVAVYEPEIRQGKEVDGFALSPSVAAERYLRARFTARGVEGTLRAAVEKADVTHRFEAAGNSAANYMNVGGHDVYDVKLKIRLEHVSGRGNVLYGKVITAQRVMKISEHASIAERERLQLEGLEALFADIDRQITKTAAQDMGL